MNQNYTLHTHTIGFDGKNSVGNMAATAKELGFHTLGISNHFIVHPNIKQSPMYPYSVRGGYSNIYASDFDEALSRFIPHYNELNKVHSPDIKILKGMEVDFFPDWKWQQEFEKVIAMLRPDYIIGSCHFVKYNDMLLNSHDWARADAGTQDQLLQSYWNNIETAAHSGLFTWMAHLDLPKKVNLGREPKWQTFEERAVSAIADANIAMEINTGFYQPNCYEPYPSPRILQMAKNKNIPVLISDDAHAASQIGRHFDDAKMLIDKFNLNQFSKIK